MEQLKKLRQSKAVYSAFLLFFLFSSPLTSATVCNTNSSGLCTPGVTINTETEVVIETYNDGTSIETTTTTTETTTTDTVSHGNSGDLLDESNGYTNHGGDQETDVGGAGSASNNSSQCRTLGTTDKCSGLTSTTLTTYEWKNLDVSGLSMEGRGGEVTYSVAIDVPSSDTTSIMITGVDDTGKTVFTDVDVLSAAGTESIGVYEGGFDFSDSFSKISIKMFGTNYQLTSAYPVFDDLQANIYWNILNSVVTQFITSQTEYMMIYNPTDPVEIDLVEDFFDHHEVEEYNGEIEIINVNEEPINDITFDSVEAELNLPIDFDMDMDFNTPVELGSMPNMGAADAATEVKIEFDTLSEDMAAQLDFGGTGAMPTEQSPTNIGPVGEVDTEELPTVVVKVSPETKVVKVDTKPVQTTKEKPKVIVKVVKEEPKEVVKVVKVKPKVVKKATLKQKNEKAAKIIKKMGDKGKYDSRNQQKVVIMVALLGADLSTYTKDAPVIEDPADFVFGTILPDGELPSNNLAMYLLDLGSSLMMNEMIDSQWKDN